MLKKIRDKIESLNKETRKRLIIIGSLLFVFFTFGFKGLILFVGGGIVYHILSDRYGLEL